MVDLRLVQDCHGYGHDWWQVDVVLGMLSDIRTLTSEYNFIPFMIQHSQEISRSCCVPFI